jgi:RNA polymerase sigma-70 factor (ECF subfamily)
MWSQAGLRDLARRVAAVLATEASPAFAGLGPLLRKATGDSAADPAPAQSVTPDAAAEGRKRDEPPSDTWRLVSLAQQGDGEAFAKLYDRYVDPVFRYIYYRVSDRALAEDFTSETFLRALRSISQLTYQGRDVGAWFTTIARNIVFDHVKSARNRFELVTDQPIEPSDPAPSTESAVLARLTAERLVAAVNQLATEQRECIVLRFMQGLSVSETAAVMGKNDGAIKALQHRAVRKLAELVAGDA